MYDQGDQCNWFNLYDNQEDKSFKHYRNRICYIKCTRNVAVISYQMEHLLDDRLWCKTAIFLDSLMTIAKALNTTMDKLFPTETSEHEDNWKQVVHRSYKNSVLYIENTNMTTKILTVHTPNVLRNHCDDALPIDIIHS